ncbi:hypothetical protein L596_010972 [Steinernema carpocapsae]|uniref:Phosphoribosyltransferase domain-containing protein n=1 Tax=Steinernema carpocapsae TaxID=34508 RepID=A0A4U5NRQ3_STECR|nr:hypothetical protein L596_010972 [Steinernema carpocapsae]
MRGVVLSKLAELGCFEPPVADIQKAYSSPSVLRIITKLLAKQVPRDSFEAIVASSNESLPLATLLSQWTDAPLLIAPFDNSPVHGRRVLVFENVVSRSTDKLLELCSDHGLHCAAVACVIEDSRSKNLHLRPIEVISLLQPSDVAEFKDISNKDCFGDNCDKRLKEKFLSQPFVVQMRPKDGIRKTHVAVKPEPRGFGDGRRQKTRSFYYSPGFRSHRDYIDL